MFFVRATLSRRRPRDPAPVGGDRLKDGQTLLVCIPPTYEQKHYSYVLLTPRVVEEEPSPVATE